MSKSDALFPGITVESKREYSADWYTPQSIFKALNLSFDLDPASPGKEVAPWIPAKRHFTILEDGMSRAWSGVVWMNPPYGKHTAEWMYRFMDHCNGVALVQARTDTRWFQACARRSGVICFISGRIRFVRGVGSGESSCAPLASVLFACGGKCVDAVCKSNLGFCVSPI